MNEVSDELRRLLDYYFDLEMKRRTEESFEGRVYFDEFEIFAKDVYVKFLEQRIDTFKSNSDWFHRLVRYGFFEAKFERLFDLVEFIVRHPIASNKLKGDLARSFVESRSAYRIIDNSHIVAIGVEEQAETYARALADASSTNATAARRQLIAAGICLRAGDWPGSVRESIHAVEVAAVLLAPEAKTLGAALNVLEKQGRLHGSLKRAFGALYGYTSDERGIRHPEVFGNDTNVDESDATFMLGACAAFVSYLLARRIKSE